MLGPLAARAVKKELMANGNYEYQSDFAKKHRAEGRAEGEATAILTILDARGLAVTSEQRRRIVACSDPAALERWIRKAVLVTEVDDLFAE